MESASACLDNNISTIISAAVTERLDPDGRLDGNGSFGHAGLGKVVHHPNGCYRREMQIVPRRLPHVFRRSNQRGQAGGNIVKFRYCDIMGLTRDHASGDKLSVSIMNILQNTDVLCSDCANSQKPMEVCVHTSYVFPHFPIRSPSPKSETRNACMAMYSYTNG